MTQVMTLSVKGLIPAKQQFEILKMPRRRRMRLLKFLGYRVIRDCRRRVSRKKDVSGRPMAKHPAGWQDKHAIDRVAKFMSVSGNDGISASVGWKKQSSADLAARIQQGSAESVNDEGWSNATRFRDKQAPATKWQARALRAAGFRQPRKSGRPGKVASVRWIRGRPASDGYHRVDWNVSAARASVILDALRKKGFKADRRAQNAADDDLVRIPARAFLGVSQAEVNQYISEILKQMKQEIARAR